MEKEMAAHPQFHCLLIGIDYYLPNMLPDGKHYPSLQGCVRDVQLFEEFFLRRLKHSQKYIHKLIAPHPKEGEAPIPAHQLPTYEHMTHALLSILKEARTGDHVWIYYAGHGGRTPTHYQKAKGQDGIDHVLVPFDIGSKKAQYLRDVELGYLLKAMVEKGLIVTLVLDCCYAGGATRGNEYVAFRGIASLDTTPRPAESIMASLQALSETWLALQHSGTRGFEISSGWLPQPEGYVLLAACREFERARESQLYGTWQDGVFTYYLLDALRQMPPESTYKMLYDRVRAKVHARFGEQTPQLEGERDRIVFGSELLEANSMINVLKIEPCEEHDDYIVELDAGQLHTLQEGAQFWVYPNPLRVSTATPSEQRLAYLEISELGATVSRAIISPTDAQRIEPGDQAQLLTPAPLRLGRKVRLLHQPWLSSTINLDWALGNVEAMLMQHNGAFVRLAHRAEVPDFLVTITSEGIYELQDVDGQPIPYLRPALPITLPGAAEKLVGRLIHLAKYQNVLLLENQSGPSSIVGKLHVELRRKQEGGQIYWRSEAGTSPILEPGEKVDLVISNTSWMRLHIAILDLAHDWSIEQLYPKSDTFALEPLKTVTIPLEARLAQPYSEGVDTLKVFAAHEVTDFRLLALPPLDQPPVRLRSGGLRNALEDLLDAFHAEAPPQRSFKVLGKAEWEWTSAQVEIFMRRR